MTTVGRIGIGTMGPPGLAADLRIRLEDAAANGLKASGAEVVTAAELARARAGASLGSCADLVCEQRLAQITDTRYWLRGSCQLDTSTYRIHLELVDARSGAVVVARDDTCDICTEADAAETANVAASALKAALGRSPAQRGNSPAASASSAANTGRAPGGAPMLALANGPANSNPDLAALPTTTTEGDAGGHERSTWRRVLPWVAFGAAAGAAAGGVYYLTANHVATECMGASPATTICHYHTDTLWQWLPLMAASAALTATGIVLLAIDGGSGGGAARTAHRTASAPAMARLSVSPAGLAFWGAF